MFIQKPYDLTWSKLNSLVQFVALGPLSGFNFKKYKILPFSTNQTFLMIFFPTNQGEREAEFFFEFC